MPGPVRITHQQVIEWTESLRLRLPANQTHDVGVRIGGVLLIEGWAYRIVGLQADNGGAWATVMRWPEEDREHEKPRPRALP